LLQNIWRPRMGWTRSSADFIRGFVAVLLFAGAQNLRRDSGYVGAFLLWVCAGRHHGRPMFHARHAIAGFIHHRALFLSTLDRRVRARHATSPSHWRTGVACKSDIVLGGIGVSIARLIPRPRDARMFQWWLAAMILFIVIVGYGNRHQWYQLPLIPIAAPFAGAACAFVGPKMSSRAMRIALSILLAGSFGFSAFVYARDFYQPSAASLRTAGLLLKRITPASALVVGADNGDPTVLYYAERKD